MVELWSLEEKKASYQIGRTLVTCLPILFIDYGRTLVTSPKSSPRENSKKIN